MLIRSILRWKNCALKRSCNFSRAKIERINTVARHVCYICTHGSSFLCSVMIWYRSIVPLSLQWRHNERDGDSNHRRLDALLHRLFRCRSRKTSKLRVTCLCEGNDRLIPLTKGQYRGKCFLLMTSLWCYRRTSLGLCTSATTRNIRKQIARFQASMSRREHYLYNDKPYCQWDALWSNDYGFTVA